MQSCVEIDILVLSLLKCIDVHLYFHYPFFFSLIFPWADYVRPPLPLKAAVPELTAHLLGEMGAPRNKYRETTVQEPVNYVKGRVHL